MHKKKGFTLIELILVLSILVILAWMGTRWLSTLEAERAYSESCTNAVYSDLADWVYYAMTSRVLSNDVSPDYYILEMDGTGYNLRYGTGDSTNYSTSGTLYLSRHVENFMYCRQSRTYHNVMSSNFKKIRMLPSLIPEGDKSGFKIYSDKEDGTRCKIQEKDNVTNKTNYLCVTGAITMNFCPITDVESACVEFGQIFFDARTGMVKKRLCKVFDKEHGGKKCKERSTGR